MKTGLTFNICHLETSHVHNDSVSDMSERRKTYISTGLSYSCQFWAEHIQATAHKLNTQIGEFMKTPVFPYRFQAHNGPFEGVIFGELNAFLQTRFLFWLEVLSILKRTTIAAQVLEIVAAWSRVRY